jgi:hypothetical protein
MDRSDLGGIVNAASAAFDRYTGSSPRIDRGEIDRAVRRLTSSLRFRIEIPGTHYSGLTNQQMLEIRQREGRDFAANNRTMRAHVAAFVRIALEGATRMPTVAEVERLQAAAVLEWILKRVDYEVRDVRIPLLTPAYQKRKRAAGFLGPVGVRTGAWREALMAATVEIE